MTSKPTLHLIAGINGAGKTSFYRYHLAQSTPGAEFVNADDLARQNWPGAEAQHVVEAARLAASRREALLAEMRTFVAETVFSHESKLELLSDAQRRGFRVILYHVHVSSPDLAKARVATRIHEGGHSVPAEKIEARFGRTLRLIPRAAECADVTLVFDNSGRAGTTHTHVLTLERGQVVKIRNPLPEWVERAYAAPLARYREAIAER